MMDGAEERVNAAAEQQTLPPVRNEPQPLVDARRLPAAGTSFEATPYDERHFYLKTSPSWRPSSPRPVPCAPAEATSEPEAPAEPETPAESEAPWPTVSSCGPGRRTALRSAASVHVSPSVASSCPLASTVPGLQLKL